MGREAAGTIAAPRTYSLRPTPELPMSYARFAAMIAVSTVVMFGLMYLNTYAVDHIFFSQTRAWMALVMGATMAIVMLGFMWSMYENRTANTAILAGSVIVFAIALYLVRSQQTVDDVSYMKAMIPHHSIAVMTSARAHIRDPRVRKLADGILEAQVREIGEMKGLIADLQRTPVPADAPDLPPSINP
jgi:peptidoglycan/LPS O-acetylase OafA/YrhL